MTVEPEMAACNAGSLNYLKIRKDGAWAWSPILFDNPVEKVKSFLDVMIAHNVVPEFECFDTGIVRSVGMYKANGMFQFFNRLTQISSNLRAFVVIF